VRALRYVLLAAAALSLGSTTARAQGFITPFLGYNFGGDSSNCESLTSCQDKRLNFGVSIGAAGGLLGFEEDIAYAKNFFGEVPGVENNVFTAMSNLMIRVPAGPVQPYVIGGIGLIRPHVSLNPTSVSSDNNALGYDLGGGVNVMFSPHTGVRGDVRHLHTLQDVGIFSLGHIVSGQRLNFWRASVGLALTF